MVYLLCTLLLLLPVQAFAQSGGHEHPELEHDHAHAHPHTHPEYAPVDHEHEGTGPVEPPVEPPDPETPPHDPEAGVFHITPNPELPYDGLLDAYERYCRQEQTKGPWWNRTTFKPPKCELWTFDGDVFDYEGWNQFADPVPLVMDVTDSTLRGDALIRFKGVTPPNAKGNSNVGVTMVEFRSNTKSIGPKWLWDEDTVGAAVPGDSNWTRCVRIAVVTGDDVELVGHFRAQDEDGYRCVHALELWTGTPERAWVHDSLIESASRGINAMRCSDCLFERNTSQFTAVDPALDIPRAMSLVKFANASKGSSLRDSVLRVGDELDTDGMWRQYQRGMLLGFIYQGSDDLDRSMNIHVENVDLRCWDMEWPCILLRPVADTKMRNVRATGGDRSRLIGCDLRGHPTERHNWQIEYSGILESRLVSTDGPPDDCTDPQWGNVFDLTEME